MNNLPHPHFASAGRFISRGHSRHPARVIDSLELIYVLSGILHIFEDKNEFHVSAGERLFLYPGRKHGGLSAYDPDLSFFWMHVTFEKEDGYAFYEKQVQYARASSPDFFSSYIQLLLSEQRRNMLEREPDLQENLNSLAQILLREAIRRSETQEEQRTSLTDFATQYIQLHFDEALTTAEIASHLQCHPDYLSRQYTKICGCTIGDTVRKERIRKACSMLENSNLSVKQIAFESGYSDVSYFRKQFFRECALTPKEYRNLRRLGHVNTE